MTESIGLEDIKNQVKQVLGELLGITRLKPGQILTMGCSPSKINSFKTGPHSSGDIEVAIFSALNKEPKPLGILLAAQRCEHFNCVLIPEEEATGRYGYETVNMVPQLKTGGPSATAAHAALEHPVVVKHIKAHVGTDVGDILAGMHLRDVTVPVRIQTKEIGNAYVMCAKTRPKFIGDVKTHYDGEHMQHQLIKREEVLSMDRAVTTSRQYGSGGHRLGEKLVMELGIPFYDKELIVMIAKEGNIESSILEVSDEVGPDLGNYSTHLIEPEYQITMTQRIYVVQETAIRPLVEKSPCIIVGRCADAIPPRAMNIFVFADMENRIKKVMSLNPELSRDEARSGISTMDRRRKAYREYYSSIEWGEMETYDICPNSGLIGADRCLDVALAYVDHIEQNV